VKKFKKYCCTQGRRLFEAFLPSRCLLCHLPSQGALLCHDCHDAVMHHRPCCQHCGCGLNQDQEVCGECLRHRVEFTQLHAIASYQAPFPALIKQLKYHQRLLYADLLGQLLAESVSARYTIQDLQRIDYIMPVPLHPQKQRKRGFNQAQVISQALSQHLPLTQLNNVITRNKTTTPQEGLTRPQRQRNLKNAFSIHPHNPIDLTGKYIVLIDDVVTTGATMNSLCDCLLKAHVARIDVWCICRTELQ